MIERLEALQVGDYASAPVLAMGDWNSQNVSEPSFGSSAHYNNSEAWKRLTGTGDAAGRHGLALGDVADLAPPGARRIDNRTSSGAQTSKPAARTDAIDEPLWPAADEPQLAAGTFEAGEAQDPSGAEAPSQRLRGRRPLRCFGRSETPCLLSLCGGCRCSFSNELELPASAAASHTQRAPASAG